MHVPRTAGRLMAAGVLSLTLATTAAAELTKDQCHDARVSLAGFVYWRVADCSTSAARPGCIEKLIRDHATWSGALQLQGCDPWPSEDNLVLNAMSAVLAPPVDFYDECGGENGQCGGACSVPFHQCQDDGGACRCVYTPPTD